MKLRRDQAPVLEWLLEPDRGHERRGLLVIATQPRTGSELLCDALTDTGLAGEPREYFGNEAVVLAARHLGAPRGSLAGYRKELPKLLRGRRPHPELLPNRRSVVDYVRELHARTSTPNGIVSTKLFSTGFERAFLRPGVSLDDLGMPVTFVRLGRRDRVAQVVSHQIASQTGRWQAVQRPRAEPAYDLDALRQSFESMETRSELWDAWLAEHRPGTPVLVYEDMVGDLAGSVDVVLASIGETRTTEIVPRQARLADRRNAEWIDRFVDEAPDLAARRWWGPSGEAPGGSSEPT